MGTKVTMNPVATALAKGAGLNVGMAGAAAIAGAYFGDNLSMISDTTIIATKGVGEEMKDKFIMNFKSDFLRGRRQWARGWRICSGLLFLP